jgi:carbon monoxide dehydrogenase subunit G
VTLLAVLLFVGNSGLFTVEASASTSYTVAVSREALRTYVDDIGLFARNMPGVVAVTPIGNGRYLYQTEKSIPLSKPLKTDFLITKESVGDSLTIYRSVNTDDHSFMMCRVGIRPHGEDSTTIEIQLRVRLSRENASEVHWLAPILGEAFISEQMTKDMDDMLREFVEKSNEELYNHLKPLPLTRR